MDYIQKYKKYKIKYLQAKSLHLGGTTIKEISQSSSAEISDNTILDPNSSLVDIDIDSDRTYYYSNQDYTNIDKEIIKLDPPSDDINNYIALFIGEGNIFNLLPTLSNYVSQIIVSDRDNRLIDYKRNELKAFIESESVYDFYSYMIRYVSTIFPQYLEMSRDMAMFGLQLAFNMPPLSDDSFLNIKKAIMKVNIIFLQIDIMDQTKMMQLGDIIKKKKITFVNRTNLMEYETEHMQIKFFKKPIPEFKNILDNFKFLPIDENVIVLFGISHQTKEKT
jgi:hypothetical protein